MAVNVDALASKLQEILLKKVAAGGFALPPLPVSVSRIQGIVKGGQGVEAIEELLEQDPVLALEVVRQAASVSSMRRVSIRTIRQAIDALGLQRMRRILSETATLSLYKSRVPDIRERCEQLWSASVAVGCAAHRVALLSGLPQPDEALLAGLMHGVGGPVAGIMLLELERGIPRHLQAGWMDVHSWSSIVERVQGPVGTAIAESWRMSREIREAVGGGLEFDAGNRQSLANAVRMGHAIATLAGLVHGGDGSEAQTMLVIGRSILGLDSHALEDIRKGLPDAA